MKILWWKVRYTLCFCQHVGWTAVALGWHCASSCDLKDWHPVDACLEELSYKYEKDAD